MNAIATEPANFATPNRPRMTEFLLTVHDMADLLCLSVREVWRREKAGTIPPAVRLSRKTVRWSGPAVEAFLAGLQGRPQQIAVAANRQMLGEVVATRQA